MLSCWHDLLFLFCLLLFYLLLPSMGWLCGVGVFGLIECPHSLPALHADFKIIIINNNTKQNIVCAFAIINSSISLQNLVMNDLRVRHGW